MEKEIKTVVVLIEFQDGSVRQVLTTKVQKDIALKMMEHEDGTLKVSEEIMPIQFEFKK